MNKKIVLIVLMSVVVTVIAINVISYIGVQTGLPVNPLPVPVVFNIKSSAIMSNNTLVQLDNNNTANYFKFNDSQINDLMSNSYIKKGVDYGWATEYSIEKEFKVKARPEGSYSSNESTVASYTVMDLIL